MARRLLLSYLALIVAIVALMAIAIHQATQQTFSQYLSDQTATHSEMLPVMLAGYYANNGSWEGVQADIVKAGYMIEAPLALTDAQGSIVAATRSGLLGKPWPTLASSL